MNDIMANVVSIAALLIGVATIAVLLNKGKDTVNIINASTNGFNNLLKTVTLQNGMGIGGGI